MKKIITIGLSVLLLSVAALFGYEQSTFNHYISEKSGSDMKTPINQKAPVKSQAEITISAPIDTVWQILTRIEDWPNWQKEVTASTLLGPLREGTAFKWKAGGLSFTSNIHTMEPKRSFGWTGRTIGASAIHNWTFREEHGTTIVSVEESLQGVFPRLFRSYFQRNLDEGVRNNLAELKETAERAES